ncbi:group 1 truncated hemoglobin [Lentisphaera marina]|uniref:group I truncated hemoglobin n=1 Tax=Lentisphaera marina TaxID=1111041 RepID=UPI00236642E1|nr:group 1 truncated hemoglobin [Lentisphaera marina]MDD7984846.1 group 1 truncated hemoglobin [Lentisphaera marina]
MQELFQKIGGVKGIENFLDQFYPLILNDKRVKHFFDGINIKDLKSHQSFFLSYVFGGVPEYTRKSLRESHEHIKITDEAFDIVLNHMLEALKTIGLDTQTIIAVMSILETTRGDLVSK